MAHVRLPPTEGVVATAPGLFEELDPNGLADPRARRVRRHAGRRPGHGGTRRRALRQRRDRRARDDPGIFLAIDWTRDAVGGGRSEGANALGIDCNPSKRYGSRITIGPPVSSGESRRKRTGRRRDESGETALARGGDGKRPSVEPAGNRRGIPRHQLLLARSEYWVGPDERPTFEPFDRILSREERSRFDRTRSPHHGWKSIASVAVGRVRRLVVLPIMFREVCGDRAGRGAGWKPLAGRTPIGSAALRCVTPTIRPEG